MSCTTENLIISRPDFDCIGQVAKHCNWEQLCLYIREQQNLYLLPKIGYCLLEKLKDDANAEDPIIKKILGGAEFTNAAGHKDYFFGLKRVLAHASYAAYIFRHGLVDTPFGVVQKLNQDSLPTPINELRSIKNEHYNNAEMYFSKFKEFIYTLKDENIIKECYLATCGKNELQEGDTQKRQYSFSNVSKDD